jgi:hypothetical protein
MEKAQTSLPSCPRHKRRGCDSISTGPGLTQLTEFKISVAIATLTVRAYKKKAL